MAIKVLLSPTENSLAGILKDEAITSIIPEQKGADVLIYSKQGLLGLQRKEVPHDFISSMTDGRMTRETTLLAQHCQYSRLVCEGKFKYYPDTTLVMDKHVKSQYSRKQVRGMLNDISLVKGIQIEYTDDIYDTVEYIRSIVEFTKSGKHLGLYTRPSAKGAWYIPTTKDIWLWLLQSFPGVGPATADNIVRKFNGEIPLQWTCTLEELLSVPRLSKERAKEMYEALPSIRASTSMEDTTTRIDQLRGLFRRDK